MQLNANKYKKNHSKYVQLKLYIKVALKINITELCIGDFTVRRLIWFQYSII